MSASPDRQATRTSLNAAVALLALALAVMGGLLAAALAPASRASAEGDESASEAAQTVEVSITSAFAPPGPVMIGDVVDLEVTVTFAAETLPNVDLIHVFEDGNLQFLGVSQGFVQLACAVFPDTPDGARATILCPSARCSGPRRSPSASRRARPARAASASPGSDSTSMASTGSPEASSVRP